MTLETSKPLVPTIGNYELLEKIAEGGMGTIHKARNRQDGQIVAIKIMNSQVASNPVLLKRFEQEFRVASTLDHPNIVRAIDYGDTGQSPYLVMEFVDGESLGQKIEREGALPETEAIRLIAQVAQGLHRAHKQGLIHRDVKPDNILLTTDNQAKLADLGLVKEVETDLNLTKTGRGLGTPHFMAPEQFRNAKNANVQCDIYSLGATLYMMVTGELPFRSNGPLDAWMKKIQNDLTPPRQIVPGLSERIDWAIRRAMSADEKQRPTNCREFIEDLTGRSTKRVPTVSDQLLNDLWYLVYKDDEGQMHTVKGSTAAIRHSLKDGFMGDARNVRAGRSKAGPFETLRGYPEFRDLVIEPAALAQRSRSTLPKSDAADERSADGIRRLEKAPGESSRNRASLANKALDPTVEAPSAAPHINLNDGPPGPVSYDWLWWVGLLVLALGGAAVAFWWLQK